jgi:hypothetical protein
MAAGFFHTLSYGEKPATSRVKRGNYFIPMEPDTFTVIAAGLPLVIQGRVINMKKPVIRYAHLLVLFSFSL